MASLVVAGDVSGSVTLSAPSAAGSTVITLPTTSGTMVVTGGAQTVQFAAGSAASPSITFTGDTNTGIFSPAADTIAFTEGGVEAMRLDSSGNVGINTTSPGVKLGVVDTSAGTITFPAIFGNRGTTNSTEVFFGLQTYDSGGAGITNGISSVTTSNTSSAGSADLKFWTTNAATRTERMRITASGAVGINNTPQTWFASETALQIGYGACVTGRTNQFDEINIYSNAYSTASGNTAYIGSSTATYYQMSGGLHRWFNAASGSAGAACSFTERMRITSNGALRVAMGNYANDPSSSNSGWSLEVNGTNPFINHATSGTGTSTMIAFINGNGSRGSIQTTSGGTSYNTTSDYRLKENIAPMTGALAKVAQLKPVTYTWKIDGSAGQGFIAHELQEIVPDAVTGEKDAVEEDGSIKPQQIDTSFLVATLTAAIQELNAKVEAQAAEIAALKGAN